MVKKVQSFENGSLICGSLPPEKGTTARKMDEEKWLEKLEKSRTID